MRKKSTLVEKSYIQEFITKNNIRSEKDLDRYIKRRKPTNMVLFFSSKESNRNNSTK